MIIVEMSGGLGNQMFQFALYIKLKNLGRDVYLDASDYDLKDNIRSYELNKFPLIRDTDVSFSNDSFRTHEKKGELWFRIRRWILKKQNSIYRDRIGIYQPEVFEKEWTRLVGYWQNEKYFSDIRDEILRFFTFGSEDVARIPENITNMLLDEEYQTVSLHVRRGDYLSARFSQIYNNICTPDYYIKAVKYITDNIANPVFFVFSDDLEWVRDNIVLLMGKNYKSDKVVFVDCNRSDRSYLDMYLMSRCRHHIIANSTFSWWGAWLGTNPDKIVISPDRWLVNHDSTDTICDGWVRIQE